MFLFGLIMNLAYEFIRESDGLKVKNLIKVFRGSNKLSTFGLLLM